MAESTEGEEVAVPISRVTAELLTGQSKSNAVQLIDFDLAKCYGDDKKNSLMLICGNCKCKVMKPGTGTLIDKEFFLPDMTTKYAIGTEPAGETIKDHWLVVDMFHFENVGFSRSVEDLKYLICADCEVGPIGWHKTGNPNEFYIACTRVKYSLE
ncbi:PREDICTED: guanine nucleotide exchange factor MSS4-like [Amphimedon queenslandica]|uniref:Uncharacterized protein n=1 Tax=Amphimedon queenslandica TaxID=400682 RepID=A0A1X7SUU3_AMPQE|nr:PREDICTED: guanine nucleotide exchange factor MSS4-like [Amphimedon queenslandica]|eukprot:XP_003391598.1 PREDICTED: guanine nucleotide exchange factor MSS4-like [Amphimedon queenslandica]